MFLVDLRQLTQSKLGIKLQHHLHLPMADQIIRRGMTFNCVLKGFNMEYAELAISFFERILGNDIQGFHFHIKTLKQCQPGVFVKEPTQSASFLEFGVSVSKESSGFVGELKHDKLKPIQLYTRMKERGLRPTQSGLLSVSQIEKVKAPKSPLPQEFFPQEDSETLPMLSEAVGETLVEKPEEVAEVKSITQEDLLIMLSSLFTQFGKDSFHTDDADAVYVSLSDEAHVEHISQEMESRGWIVESAKGPGPLELSAKALQDLAEANLISTSATSHSRSVTPDVEDVVVPEQNEAGSSCSSLEVPSHANGHHHPAMQGINDFLSQAAAEGKFLSLLAQLKLKADAVEKANTTRSQIKNSLGSLKGDISRKREELDVLLRKQENLERDLAVAEATLSAPGAQDAKKLLNEARKVLGM